MVELLNFHVPITKPWQITQIGAGEVLQTPDALSLTVPTADAATYHDAQLTDFTHRSDFRWRPPLRLEVHARCATDGSLVGTAGFGFWNHPYGLAGERLPRLPKAIWFFFSAPPSRMQLAQDVPATGWKAATVDTTRWQFKVLAPTAPIGLLLMRNPTLYQHLWPIGQRAIGVSEKLLHHDLLHQTHQYCIDWLPDRVIFAVDGAVVHEASLAISGEMGFIAWIDNQYAVVTPQGHVGAGVVAIPQTQSLVLSRMTIRSGV